MEESITQGLKNLQYDKLGSLKVKEMLKSADLGSDFIQLVCWLVDKLKSLVDVDIANISGEVDTFCLELIGILRDLACPYASIIGGKGLQTEKGKMFTLDYLISELQAARMYSSMNDDDSKMDVDSGSAVSIPIANIMQTLNVPMSSNNNVNTLFNDINQKLQERLKTLPVDHLQEPLLKKSLSEEQWSKVSQINDAMCQDYKQRREVLIKRVDVTVQSFCWSEKLKSTPEQVATAFQPIRQQLHADSITSTADILATRTDLYPVERTSSGASREATKCDLNKIIIPKVPDRGGRPSKQAPPPEMPKFMKRVADPPRGGGGGGGRGRGGYRGRGGSGSSGRGGGGGGGGGGGAGYDGGRGGNDSQGGGGGARGGGRGGYNRGGKSNWRGKQGGRGGGRDYESRPSSGDSKMYYS